MAKPFSVQCPSCEARLKIQNPKAIGKKVRCPNCETPFLVEAPRPAAPADDFGLEDDYDDYDDTGDDYDDYDEGPPRRGGRRPASASRPARGGSGRSAGPRGKKRPRKKNANNKVALIAGGAVLAFLLLMGLGFMIYQFAGGSKVDYAWLPPDAEMIVSVDVDDVWDSALVQRIKNSQNADDLKRGLEDMERELQEMGFQEGESLNAIDSVTAGFTDVDRRQKGLAVIRKKSAWNVDAIKEKKRLEEKERSGKTYYTGRSEAYFFPDSETMVVGDREVVEAALDRGPESNIGEKFSFLPKGQIVVGFLPNNTDDFTREMGSRPMRGMLAGGNEYSQKIADAIKEVKGGALVVNVTGGVELDVIAKCSNSDVAGNLASGIDEALADGRKKFDEQREKSREMLDKMPPEFRETMQTAMDIGESVLNTVGASRSGESVTISMELSSSNIDKIEQMAQKKGGGGFGPRMPFDLDDLLPKFGGGRVHDAPAGPGGNPFTNASEAAKRARDKNNLKQIGLAMHNYHDTFRSLPVAKDQQNQSPQLSWRVHLLPYLDQAPLYEQFRKNEPWNSPHNLRLVNQMPDIFRKPGSNAGPGKTNYVGISGPGGLFENGGGVAFREVRDGVSNTIMVTQVEDHAAVVWTQPVDYQYNQANPKQNLGGWQGGFHALMGDGAVVFLSENINPQQLLYLFQRNDGNAVSPY